MKIYSYVRYSWNKQTQSYEKTKSISKEYTGRMALCFFGFVSKILGGGGGDTHVHAPKPSAEEKQLQQEQLKILQQQQSTSKRMEPFVLKSMGIVEEGDVLRYMTEEERLANMTSLERSQYEQAQETTRQQGLRWEEADKLKPFMLEGMGLTEEGGALRYLTEEERLAGMTSSEKSQYEIEQLQQERLKKAYAGELPISPALEQRLTKQEEQIAEALSQRLGSGWQSTTSGQQAMSTFRKDANLLREETRRGEISTGTGLLLAGLDFGKRSNTQQLGQYGTFPQRTAGLLSGYNAMLDGTAQQTGSGAAKYPYLSGPLFQQYGMLQQPYQQQRQMEFNASISNAQAKADQQAGFWSGMGQLAGAGMQAYGTYAGMAAMSSRIFKKNIATILSPLEKLKQIRGVEFDWKDESGHDSGVIAEEVEGIIPGIIDEIDGIKHVRYHTLIPFLVEALKAQQEQINILQEKN